MLGVCDGGHSALVMNQVRGLDRPGCLFGIAALRREDFDAETVNVRGSVVCGIVDVPKTLESVATLPDQVKDPKSVGDEASFRQQSFGNAANSVAFIDLPGSPT